MQLTELISALSDPHVYPYEVESIEVCQTHISVVFLAGAHVYKVKKPVQFGFLDFSTLELREKYCHEEVRLNRRLAAHVYLGVVPIAQTEHGIRLEKPGEVLEWAVKMVRLPDEATLEQRLAQGKVDESQIRQLARRIADFHRTAESNETISTFGTFAVVARNARENFEQSRDQIGTIVSEQVFQRVQALTESALTTHQHRIESRATQGQIRDTHGDLRLDHAYFFPEAAEPDDILILDCIEFNERFRFADPVADMAFLVMDLLFHGYREVAQWFTDEYFRATSDTDGAPLLPFYTAYRATVRAKVEGIKATEAEVAQDDRDHATHQARAHWLLALAQLAPANETPCLLLIGGPPGSGKSTLAKALCSQANFTMLRTDVIRKELAGIALASTSSENIYTQAWNERTYAECQRRAVAFLNQGQRVIIDASFREEANRQRFLDLGIRCGVPTHLLMCQVSEDVARKRLQGRVDDASDADFAIFLKAEASWEPPSPATQRVLQSLNTDGTRDEVVREALAWLESVGLVSPTA